MTGEVGREGVMHGGTAAAAPVGTRAGEREGGAGGTDLGARCPPPATKTPAPSRQHAGRPRTRQRRTDWLTDTDRAALQGPDTPAETGVWRHVSGWTDEAVEKRRLDGDIISAGSSTVSQPGVPGAITLTRQHDAETFFCDGC